MKNVRRSDSASTSSSVPSNNYFQLFFVFGAFSLMALASYFFIGRILQSRLLSGANELLFSAEANVKAGLSEAETTLINSYYVVQNMVENGAPREEILDYLTVTTEWMRKRDQGLLGYMGIYGYINGDFYDSIGINPGDDYIPQTSPWYQTAVRNTNVVAYTVPYMDWRTGGTIVSAVRTIDINGGEVVGILVVDIDIEWLMEYIGSLALANNGYGMLLSQNMTVMAYPDSSSIGWQLQDLGGDYLEIARILRSGEEISASKINDLDGGSVIVFFKQIFNNWYVGIVTPNSQFYKDLYTSAQILAALGIVLALGLCFILLRISAARTKADKESKSKSSFLANMSHEIRTPMNAIIGMTELLLRGELSDEARSYAQDIKQAGNNLVFIINDILDFSKIEAGKLEIVPVKYMLSSLINDLANIIRVRIIEKSLRFFSNMDVNIPNNLIGDEVRLRQILLNLLSNAVKYSEKGHIGLYITAQKRDDKQIWLKIDVSDTGSGIKKEDQEKLFDDFVRIDTKKNRNIEGTGLGLAITKRLCLAMGGDVTVESEYGQGSTFTAIIPQLIDSPELLISVEEPERKKVLIYDSRSVYAESIRRTLENMGVPCTVAANQDDFAATLLREEWFYVFTGYGLYEKVKPLMEQSEDIFAGGKKPPVALMVEWGNEAFVPNVRFLSLPVQCLSVASLLNGKEVSKSYTENSGVIRCTFPGARLLVVDDIATNLKVIEGLLAPYKAVVDTCLTGFQAIEMVKQHTYDLVLMDHMMPEIDGIETTAVIRAWENEQQINKSGYKPLPIIALTANAVAGMREVFIGNNFTDFLAKPVDISKLDGILDRWMPKENRDYREYGWENGGCDKKPPGTILDQNTNPAANHNPNNNFPAPGISCLDTAKGIANTGGTLDAYRQVLVLFCKDAEERLPVLKKTPEADDLSMFITQVHALKSASASIGSSDVPALAAELEAAGKAGNTGLIKKQLPVFVERLTELTGKIRIWENETRKHDPAKQAAGFTPDCITALPLLHELSAALKAQNTEEMDRVLEQLEQQTLDAGTRTVIEQISCEILMAEFVRAEIILDGLLEGKV